MKTVMKKMFSLLLVAVLLVGVMPFAVVADTVEPFEIKFVVKDTAGNTLVSKDAMTETALGFSAEDYLYYQYDTSWSDNYTIDSIKVNGESVGTSYVVISDDIEDGKLRLGIFLAPKSEPDPEPEHTHSFTIPEVVTDATCGDAGSGVMKCSCGESGDTYVIPATGNHTEAIDAAVPATHTETGLTEGKHCSVCGDVLVAQEVVPALGHGGCTDTVTVVFEDRLNGDITETYDPGDSVDFFTPDWVDGYDFVCWRHNGKAVSSYKIPASACGSTITFTAKWEETTTLTKYPVSVYARLKIGDIVQDVDLIHKHSTLLANDKILDYLKHPNTMAELWSIIENKYPGYEWSENFHNAYGDTAATDNITVVDGSKSVYINLYAEQDDVRLYVYTEPDCENYELLYELDGYKHNSVNDTVTSGDVLSFLKGKLGSGISIKMFDEEGFEGYWRGKENTSTNFVAVKKGTTKIHVRVYNAYSSSSSSKADSSNPKTGDAIFAPVMILGASASALAVLFYLNKKRAY